MAYIVNKDIPKHCNMCPFGVCAYSKPNWSSRPDVCQYDHQVNEPGTFGYRCLAVPIDTLYRSTVVRAKFDEDIEKPSWCPLVEVPNGN